MPELPDIVVYIEALEARIVGHPIERVRLANPFVLRSVDPTVEETHGKTVTGLRRLGKRIVVALRDELFIILHLMIAGRLHWRRAGSKIPKKLGLVAFDFPSGTVLLTEAGSKRRASLHIVRGEAALHGFDPGGLEVLEVDLPTFRAALTRRNHTLKRALTDPRLLSGIGNAYSDEILHKARLSPLKLTQQLSEDECARLFQAARHTLLEWTDRLRRQTGSGFPEQVTAFREEMAVHGRYRKPCRDCGSPIQRVVYVENETNYCARCQTGGKLLTDRALSRLLRKDWPRTLDELEAPRVGTA
ncbi:MAG: Fpg/Nei family DNA glycosylase [Candidatus Methylomirabilaceae bacterium]